MRTAMTLVLLAVPASCVSITASNQQSMPPQSLLDAIDLGPGITEHYANTHASTRHEQSALQVKAACDAAVSTVLGPHASVQAAGSRGKGTAITTSDYDLFVRRTPPINASEVSKAQARSVGAAAVQQLQSRGLRGYTNQLGKVVTLKPPPGSISFETDLAFDWYKGVERHPPNQQLRHCPGLKLVVRCFKLLSDENPLPSIRAAHSIEQFVYASCSGRQPESIKLAVALPLCLEAVAGTRPLSQAQKELMAEAGLQRQVWRNYANHVLQRMRQSNKWGVV